MAGGRNRLEGNDKEEGLSADLSRRGQYSDAVLNELESQNDQQVEGILGKVRVLKDVRSSHIYFDKPDKLRAGKTPTDTPLQMTTAIGEENRESSALADKMNEGFDNTRVRLRGTMNRMLVMAERSGIPWKVWLGFFLAVILIFLYVWLF